MPDFHLGRGVSLCRSLRCHQDVGVSPHYFGVGCAAVDDVVEFLFGVVLAFGRVGFVLISCFFSSSFLSGCPMQSLHFFVVLSTSSMQTSSISPRFVPIQGRNLGQYFEGLICLWFYGGLMPSPRLVNYFVVK